MLGSALALSGCHDNGTVFTVDRDFDGVDINPGDGVCADDLGLCPLRAAVMEASALPGVQRIDGDGLFITDLSLGDPSPTTARRAETST
ncbi:MAG: hypothetical protein R2695_16755 [Acidimicrobiales bacterium]